MAELGSWCSLFQSCGSSLNILLTLSIPLLCNMLGKKKERSKINNLHFYLRKLEKEEQIKPKVSRRFKILAQKSMKLKPENQQSQQNQKLVPLLCNSLWSTHCFLYSTLMAPTRDGSVGGAVPSSPSEPPPSLPRRYSRCKEYHSLLTSPASPNVSWPHE